MSVSTWTNSRWRQSTTQPLNCYYQTSRMTSRWLYPALCKLMPLNGRSIFSSGNKIMLAPGSHCVVGRLMSEWHLQKNRSPPQREREISAEINQACVSPNLAYTEKVTSPQDANLTVVIFCPRYWALDCMGLGRRLTYPSWFCYQDMNVCRWKQKKTIGEKPHGGIRGDIKVRLSSVPQINLVICDHTCHLQ